MGLGRSVGGRLTQAVAKRGPAGAQGAAGAGALGVDVWASQGNPGAVTDWGAVANTLISGGAKLLNFSAHDFPCTTQINLNDKYAIRFQGEAGGIHPTVGGANDHPAARLIWKGAAGSGIFITMNGSDGIQFSNLGLVYDNAAYNGDLISCDFTTSQTANALFERCQIGYINWSGVVAARSLLRWTNAVSCTARECSFNGAQTAFRGFETTDSAGQATAQQHPDNNRVVHCTFRDFANSFFTNVGNYWTIEDNEFLFGALQSVNTPTCITSDVTCNSDFTYERNRHWDFSNSTQHALKQLVTNGWTARIKHCFFDTHAGVNIQLDGGGTVTIEDNGFARAVAAAGTALIDLGNPATAYKHYARIKGNIWTASSSPAVVIVNTAGHGAQDIGPNVEVSGSEVHANAVHDFAGHARAHWSNRWVATVGLAAGQPAITIDGKLQDRFGYITFQMPGGSASVAGKLATVTFSAALEKGYGQGTPDATHQVPIVKLFPFSISNDSVTLGATSAAGFEPKVTGGQQLTFDIYTANAIPAAAKVGIGYEVVSM